MSALQGLIFATLLASKLKHNILPIMKGFKDPMTKVDNFLNVMVFSNEEFRRGFSRFLGPQKSG